MADKGFQKAEGMHSEPEMENERGQTTIGEEGDPSERTNG